MCLSIPGKLIRIQGEEELTRTGRVDFGGIIKEVNLAYVPSVKLGDYVIVHVGFAISVLDPMEAQKTLEYLKEMDALDELKA